MTVLVTGVAGFIGMHAARALLDRGDTVVGVDNLDPYYDPRLKRARLVTLEGHPRFQFHLADIADRHALPAVAATRPDIDRILHLAAQPGVRHSLVDPYAYVTANVMGHLVVLELARRIPRLRHLVYASSSSVYGGNTRVPFSETDEVARPVSLYAATKRCDELMSETYRHLFGVPQTGLRFFTVYGPWGRPDMAVWSFSRAILRGEPITLYDDGALQRDFTDVDDIVAGVLGCLDHPEGAGRVYNIGNRRPERTARLVELLEAALGRKAVVENKPRPDTEVLATFADTTALEQLTGVVPRVPLAEGIPRFTRWLLEHTEYL